MRRLLLILMGLLAALAVAACGGAGGGQSDKAQKQVCDARADIAKQVDELKALTVTTATVSGVKENVSAIQADLKQIMSAQDTLKEDRRADVKAATDQFLASVTSIVKGLTTDVSLSEAKARLAETGQQLRAAYAESLGRIDCP